VVAGGGAVNRQAVAFIELTGQIPALKLRPETCNSVSPDWSIVTEPKVLMSRDRAVAAEPRFDRDVAWRVVFIPAVLFVVVGGIDSLLTWFPANFGTTEWEFGTITASLNGLPLPVLGLTLLLLASIATGRLRLARLVLWLMVLVAVAVLAMMVLYLLTLPQAFRAASEASDIARVGLKKAMIKSVVQLICYPAALVTTAVLGWRTLRSNT